MIPWQILVAEFNFLIQEGKQKKKKFFSRLKKKNEIFGKKNIFY
jgi:hypothetical protein